MKKLLLQFLLMSMAVLVHATQQTITIPANANTFTYVGCQINGTGGNNIDNASFFQVPGSFPGGGTVSISVWECTYFVTYYFYNTSDGVTPGWYDGNGNPANVVWNPGEGMAFLNSSGSSVTFTLNGTTPTPVLPPVNYCGCGGWSLLSCQTNSATSSYQQVTGFAPVSGSKVSVTYSNGPANPYIYANGNWTPATPILTNGQAAFFYVPCVTNCISIQCSNVAVYVPCSTNCVTVGLKATAIDTCCTNVTVSFDYPTNYCFPVNSSSPVEVFATDPCGNSNSASFTVTIVGTNCCSTCTNCISIVYSNVVAYAPCGSNCVIVPLTAGAIDNCCSNSVTLQYYEGGASIPAAGTCFNVGTTPVTAVATDGCGNGATNVFDVTVLASAPCSTNCITIISSNLVAYAPCNSNCVIVPLTATAIDNCCTNSVTLQYFEGGVSIPATGTCFNVGTTPITVVATDACGNSATNTFEVIVEPLTGITIQSTNETVYSCSNCTTVPFQVTVLDPCCSNGLTVSYNYATNYCFPVNSTTPVTVFATDGCGNFATNTFNVTVIQVTNPVIISCPTNITICMGTTVGAIIADSDEWVLSDQGFNSEGDGAVYADNCAAYLTGGRGTNILIYSSDFGLDGIGTGGSDFTNALKNAGYNVTLDTPPTPALTLSYLSGFDAVFVGGDALTTTDLLALEAYVCDGGGVYVAAGTGQFGPAPVEAGQWNILLNPFGLSMANTYNSIDSVLTVGGGTLTVGSSPVMNGVTALDYDSGNDISVIGGDPQAQVIAYSGSEGLIGVSGCMAMATNGCGVMPDETGLVIVSGGGTVTQSPPPGTTICSNTIVTFTVSNLCGEVIQTNVLCQLINCASNNCLQIECTNLLASVCNSNCAIVPLTATPIDTCCSNVTLQYYAGGAAIPATGNCFNVGTTPVTVVAKDSCGNAATNSFDVIVQQVAGTITIHYTNETVYTCSNCTMVPFLVTASNPCCTNNITLSYDYPTNYCFPVNTTNMVEVFATDLCGDTNTASFTVTVLPATNCCRITILSSNLLASLPCGSNCVVVPLTATAIDNCCTNGVTLQYYEGGVSIPALNTCFSLGTTPVRVVATDGCGNSATNVFDVIVQQAPDIITIQYTNETVYTCSNCTMVPFQVSASDPCCSNKVTLSYDYPTNYCFSVSTTNTVEVIATDPCGNSNSASFTVTVLPCATCCTNCNPPYPSSYSVTVNPGFNFLADNLCQGTNAITGFLTNAPNGSEILLWNGSGYSVGSTRTLGSWSPSLSLTPGEGFVLDVPAGTAPFTITISGCEPSCPPPCEPTNGLTLVGTLGIITNATWTNLFSCPPPCGAEMQLWNPSSQSFTTYNYANGAWTPSVPVLAVGESAFVTVVPCTNCITIACSNLLASAPCGSNCVIVPLTATPTDTCCSNVTLQYYAGGAAIPVSGTCFNLGTTLVTVVARDSCGNSATNSFDVIVQQAAGTITIQYTNETFYTCSNCTMVPFLVTASDPCCSNNVTLSYDYPTNYCFPVNTTNPVEVIATDTCGNTNTASFTVTVLPATNCCRITILSSNLLASAPCGSNCVVVPLTATATDPCCTNNVTLQYYEGATSISALNTCFSLGTTPVRVVATDSCGNSATNLFDVIVQMAAGTITIYSTNETFFTCSNCTMVPFQVTASDPCCSNKVTLSYDYPTNYCFQVKTTNTVEVIATDTCGNTNTASFTVTVMPATNFLQFNCLTNLTVECGTLWTSTPPVIVSSCCPSNSIFRLFSVTNGTCPKYITNSWRISDSCGDTDFCTQVITVEDTNPPVIIGGTNSVIAIITTNCELVIPPISVIATDSCTPQCLLGQYQSPAANTIVPGPSTNVTVTVTNLCGNATQCKVLVQGVYKRGLVVTWPTQLISSNCLVPCVNPTIEDCSCSNNITITQSPMCDTNIGPGNYRIHVTVTDCHGLTVSTNIPLTEVSTEISFTNVLFNTGVAANRSLLTQCATDPHYTLGPVGAGGCTLMGYNAPNALAATNLWPWMESIHVSEWISPNCVLSPDMIFTPYGFYTYTNQFVLPQGVDASTASISGRWEADNGATMTFNGTVTPNTILPPMLNPNYWTDFTINGNFLPYPQVNTVTFVVTNMALPCSPTGLRVEYLAANACSTCSPPAIISFTTPPNPLHNGSSGTFNVQADGTPPLTYQWLYNGNPIPGANSKTLHVNHITFASAGTYTVIVTDPCGSATNSGRISVVPALAYTNAWWTFDNRTNPLSATFGPDLLMPDLNSGTNFSVYVGNTEDLGLPNPGGQIVNVMGLNPLWPDTITLPPILPAGSTSNTDYTVIMDIYQPDTSLGTPSTLFESAGDGSGIALTLDVSNHLDITGTADGTPFDVTSTMPMSAGTWHRLALVVTGPAADIGSSVTGYLDGGPITTVPGFPFNCPCCNASMNSAIYYLTNPPTILSGTNNAVSNGELDISGLQFHTVALAPQIIAAMSAPDSGPEPNVSNLSPPSSAPALSGATANGTVSFTWLGGGFVLQETTDLTSGEWTDSDLPFTEAEDAGGNITTAAIVAPTPGTPAKFYRLVFRP